MKKEKAIKIRGKEQWLFPIVLIRTVINGLFGSLTNVLLLSIAEDFGLSTSELGGLLGANYVASIVMPLIAGRLGDLFGKKRVLVASIVISLAGGAMIVTAPTVGMYVAGTIIAGLGGQCENSVFTPAIADTYPEKATRYISLMQVFISIAGMVSPFIVEFCNIKLGLTWREIKLISLVTMCIPYLLTIFIKIKTREGQTARGFKEVKNLLTEPSLLLGAAVLIFYCATDNLYVSFLKVFLTEKFGAAVPSALALTLHSMMYVIARFAVGYVKKGQKIFGIVTIGLASVFMFLASVIEGQTATIFCCTMYSLFFAPAYPIIVSEAAVSYPGNSATATSLMFIGGGLGGMLMSTPASLIVGNLGAASLIKVLAGTSTAAMILYVLYSNSLAKKEAIQGIAGQG